MTDHEFISDIIRAIASALSASSVLALLIAILRNPKVLSNIFNLYLVFCLAPDAIYFLLMPLVNSLREVEDQLPRIMQDVNWFIEFWVEQCWLCASLWMSFSVFVQMYKLIIANKREPQTRKRVIKDSTIILIFSGVVATLYPLFSTLTFVVSKSRRYFVLDTEYSSMPTLLITGMCIGVLWSKLLPRKNARYRSLTMFFARLLASVYLMVIGAAIKWSLYYWPEGNKATQNLRLYSHCIYYLFGFFQACLALTKKDIRNAFAEMWCSCRKHDNGVTRSSTFFGRTSRTSMRESYGPETDSCDVVPPIVDDTTSSVLNQDINENDGNEATTSFADTTEQNEKRRYYRE